ncbi:efflux RND transporter permease subunit, partial [Escherichia coli]|nr:efflux RND transporter permease subunit [Escherichia coli]
NPPLCPPRETPPPPLPRPDAKTGEGPGTPGFEQNVDGSEYLMYMSSNSDSTGTVQITLTFESGTDADIAQVQVQNKLQLAMRSCAQEVPPQGGSVLNASAHIRWVGACSNRGSPTGGGCI